MLSEPIRIAIFEDHEEMRRMYEMMIDSEDDMLCVGAFDNVQAAVKMVEKCLPDVVLMDIEMPGKNGITAVRELKAAFPDLKIIMQTIFSDDDKIFDSLCFGASGYLLKNRTIEEFTGAIRQVHSGGAPMSPQIAAKVLQQFRNSNVPTHNKESFNLTDREHEILVLLVKGMSYKLIAAQLHLSYYTVDSHIRKIYDKLHVRSATEAVRKAIDSKIV